MSFKDKLDNILAKHAKLEEQLSSGVSGQEFVKISKDLADLNEIVDIIKKFKQAENAIDDLQAVITDPTADKELKEMAEEELHEAKKQLTQLEHNVKIALLPKDEADQKNAIIEIRAGTGGEEAALFAYTLFQMYQRYSASMGWKFEIMSISPTGIGGYKEASALVSGNTATVAADVCTLPLDSVSGTRCTR